MGVSAFDIKQNLERTEESLQDIENKHEQNGDVIPELRKLIKSKSTIVETDKKVTWIENVRKFRGEAAQFEANVEGLKSRGASRREAAKRIAYEEDEALKDGRNAAESIIEFGALKERAKDAAEESRSKGKSLKELGMEDNFLVFDTVLIYISHYYWESYKHIKLRANELSNETGYTQFSNEFKKFGETKEFKRAADIIREEYGGPSSIEDKRKRDAHLEANLKRILSRFEELS